MKKLITIAFILISTLSFGQQRNFVGGPTSFEKTKDSIPPIKDTLSPKVDTSITIMNDFLVFLQDKVTVKDYIPVQQMVTAFLKSKEFKKPKTK